MRKFKFALASALIVGVPVSAYALSMFPVRVTVDAMPTNYRAMVIDGTTYVALRDVATLTGRRVSYSSATRTVNISGGATNVGTDVSFGGNGSRGGSTVGVGGTTQRPGTEGAVGQLLVTPRGAIRVDGVKRDDDEWVTLRGVFRNTSKVARTYTLKDAVLVDSEGNTVKSYLSAREMNGEVYSSLQPGEQGKLEIQFKTQAEAYQRAVITLSDNQGGDIVFRVQF